MFFQCLSILNECNYPFPSPNLHAYEHSVPETVSDGGVLLHIHRQIQEVLVFTAHLQHKREHSGYCELFYSEDKCGFQRSVK